MTLVERDNAQLPGLPTVFDPYEEISRKAKPRWSKAVMVGYLIILVFFGGFGGFSAFAPLHSAVMAPGELRVDNERKLVQHPEGGIVTEILVREGQRVEEGEVLLRLDPTRDKAQANILNQRYISALAQRARLIAERDSLPEIEFPPEVLSELSDPQIAEIVEGERNVFRTSRESRDGQVNLILGQIDQAKAQMDSIRLERSSVEEQLSLIEQELRAVRELYEKGLERLPRLLALQRNEAALKGQIGRLNGSLAQLEKQIGDSELRIVQVERDFQSTVAQRLDVVVEQIQQLNQQRPVVSQSVKRLEIKAPRSGRVIDLTVHTIGQVIGGREAVMQIVPEDEDLIVIAKVKPRDIDELNGEISQVQVRLTAFSQRFMHPVKATVESVSTDVIEPPNGGSSYYRVILRLDPDSQEHILKGQKLTSGMPALAMIGVGEKTLLSYLIEPLWRSVSESLREP